MFASRWAVCIVFFVVFSVACQSASEEAEFPGLPGSGDTGLAGTNEGGGSGVPATSPPSGDALTAALSEIEGHCATRCESILALPCGRALFSGPSTCTLQCVAIAENLGGFCLGPYHDFTACQADGGYECAGDALVPSATCASETLDFQQCAVAIPCMSYCTTREKLGCADSAYADCVAACNAEIESEEDCDFELRGYRQCQGDHAESCVAGDLVAGSICGYAIGSYDECKHDHHAEWGRCQAWCWAADALGCGEGCAADCAAYLADPACGEPFDTYVGCSISFANTTCGDDGPYGDGVCDNDGEKWEACLTDAP